MPAKQNDDISNLRVDMGIVKSQMAGVMEQNERIEKKIDQQNNVSNPVFEKYKEEVKNTYMTKEEFKPFKWVIMSLGGAMLTALGAAIARFVLNGGLK